MSSGKMADSDGWTMRTEGLPEHDPTIFVINVGCHWIVHSLRVAPNTTVQGRQESTAPLKSFEKACAPMRKWLKITGLVLKAG